MCAAATFTFICFLVSDTNARYRLTKWNCWHCSAHSRSSESHKLHICVVLHHNREVRFVWEKAAGIKSQALIAPVDQSVSLLCFNCTSMCQMPQNRSHDKTGRNRRVRASTTFSHGNAKITKSPNRTAGWEKKLISPFLCLSVLPKPTEFPFSFPSHLKEKLVHPHCGLDPQSFRWVTGPTSYSRMVVSSFCISTSPPNPTKSEAFRFERHQSRIYICRISHPK